MNFADKIKVTKLVVSIVVGSGTSKIVRDIIVNNTDCETVTDKVKIMAGSFAIGGMITSEASKYTDRMIDKTADSYLRIKQHFEEARAEDQ